MRLSIITRMLLTAAVLVPCGSLLAQNGGAGASAFSGQYFFDIEGQLMNSPQAPHAENLGSFFVDGNGNVVSGVEDFNSTSYRFTALPITGGSYTLNASGTGTLKLITSSMTQVFNLYIPGGSVSTGAKTARIIETDGAIVNASGTVALQTTSAFTSASDAGRYTFSLNAETYDSTGSLSDLLTTGDLNLGLAGDVTGTYSATLGGVQDVSSTSFTATASTPSTATGRFAFLFGGIHYAGYIVDAKDFDVISLDPWADATPLFHGAASR